MSDNMPDDAKALLLTMRFTLLRWQSTAIERIPDDGRRERVRAGWMQILIAIEDVLGLPHTIQTKRDKQKALDERNRLQGVVD